MSAAQAPAGLEVPARVIPVPKWVSPEAQAYLARGPLQIPPNPALDDLDGWGHRIAFIDQMVLKMEAERGDLAPPGFALGEVSIGDAAVYTVTPPDLSPGEDRVYLDIHGGAFIVGGGEVCRAMAVRTAAQLSVRVWSVDYRMPPDHPCPAAVDDCLAAYRAVLRDHRPEDVVVGGGSAGGNLAAALILRARSSWGLDLLGG